MPGLDFDEISDTSTEPNDRLLTLRHAIDRAAHLLPSQGPITVFVHHNTLHAFEHLDFDAGVQAGGRLFGCHAYLPEERYREKLRRGRIRVEDLEAVLQEDLGDEADRLVSIFCTRYALRLSMMQFSLRSGTTHELRWVVAESDALRRFREVVPANVRTDLLADTRKAVLERTSAVGKKSGGPNKSEGETLSNSDDPTGVPANAGPSPANPSRSDVLGEALNLFDGGSPDSWNDRKWEAFVLNYLWRTCCEGVRKAATESGRASDESSRDDSCDFSHGDREEVDCKRHRDLLLEAGGDDADLPVHAALIRFCSAFLDQGFADWHLPGRETGLFASFLRQHAGGLAPTRWFREVRRECRRLLERKIEAIESIDESLTLLGVSQSEHEEFITQSLLALRGWAGMVWQMESNAEWAPHPAPPGSLIDFLAVRLLLDRISLRHVASDCSGFRGPLSDLRAHLRCAEQTDVSNRFQQRAFTVFQLAQVLGWRPRDLESLAPEQWAVLVDEIESFPSLQRRRIYHRAFERKYRNETLDAVIAHNRPQPKKESLVSDHTPVDGRSRHSQPLFQIACCIDEREESFRRHLEEVQPECETFGIAGFFGVAMYYRGAGDAHFTPLCPVNVKPAHFVVETPVYSAVEVERKRADARRRIGYATHQAHLGTRSFLGGVVAGLFGSVAAIPLVARILFPRTTAQIRRVFGSIVRTTSTELRLERVEAEPGNANGSIGYLVDEMAAIVEGGLRAMGLANAELLSRLVVICGHGSASLNNPHEAAHDCGACGGGGGGPNARAFAQMANDPRVRTILAKRGIPIPTSTLFVGGYHNTCDDSMTWYDLDRVPIAHRDLFEQAKSDIDEARKRSSHERCRRFASADPTLDFEDSLRHVEGRAEDLSQTRPEYGHATNALCFVGRRDWSRGLFLDRRAFLTSYDPTQDDNASSILERMLQAVIPVCAGINLEYYFSYVDPIGYGCGTKLPHNITSLLGVMDGAQSDLRPGLPWQMVEIHEPVRLLFVIESTPEAMTRIIDENDAIARLVKGGWVQLAVFNATTNHVHRFVRDEFVLYAPHEREIPSVTSSLQWYGGQRDHLGFASIAGGSPVTAGTRVAESHRGGDA